MQSLRHFVKYKLKSYVFYVSKNVSKKLVFVDNKTRLTCTVFALATTARPREILI